MGRSKQNKSSNQKTHKIGPGQHRKETKDERRARLIEEAKAKEDCLKILPIALGIIILFIIIFVMSVRSLSAVKLQIKNDNLAQKQKEYNDNLNHIDELRKNQKALQDKMKLKQEEIKALEEKIKKNEEECSEHEDIFDLDE